MIMQRDNKISVLETKLNGGVAPAQKAGGGPAANNPNIGK